MLETAAARGATDVLLIAGAPAMLRVTGNLTPAGGAVLDAEDVRSLVLPLLEPAQFEELQKRKRRWTWASCARTWAASASTSTTSAARSPPASGCCPREIPSLESLHLPLRLAQTGRPAAGTGAGHRPHRLRQEFHAGRPDRHRQHARAAHIVTIEDPVEYQHANRSAIIEQIEVGRDTPDFAVTLRSIMRQTPDVILVGEMRDAETIATALTAAETGHLVLSTLHTNDAIQSMSRILDSFPAGNQPQIRQQLSLALAAVIAQQLVPGVDGSDPLARHRDHDRHRRRARPDPQGRRPPAALADLGGAGRGHDDDGAIAGRTGAAGRITRDTAYAHGYRTDDLQRYLG